MKCPYCGYQESKVVDSRHSDDGLSIRRRRECLQCQKRFTTYETVESLPIVVIKREGNRQSFDRNKILNGIPLEAWITYMDYVALDDVAGMLSRYDPKANDYAFSRKERGTQ